MASAYSKDLRFDCPSKLRPQIDGLHDASAADMIVAKSTI